MKSLIPSLVLVLSLSACGHTKPFIEQQNLLVKCQELPDHVGTTGKDVINTMTTWGALYTECKERHNALVNAVTTQK